MGQYTRPQTFNPYAYGMNNPINYTDPSGKSPSLLLICLGLALADGPLPLGDATCAILLAAAGIVALGSIFVVQHPEVVTRAAEDVTGVCERLLAPPITQPNERVGTKKNPFALPYEYRAPKPEQQPQGTPVVIPLPTAAPEDEDLYYHYGTGDKINYILMTQTIPVSDAEENSKRARYGSGVYFTDIVPGSITKAQIARALYGSPHLGNQAHVEAWVEVDLSGLAVIYNGPHNYLVRTLGDLSVVGRITRSGWTP